MECFNGASRIYGGVAVQVRYRPWWENYFCLCWVL